MKAKSKQSALHLAEVIDSLRIVPRVFLGACFTWSVEVTWQLLSWYTALPKDERSLETSGFASIVWLGVLGFLKLVYSEYSAHSRDWNAQPTTTTTVASVTTSTP